MGLLDIAYGSVRLGQGLAGKSGRQQYVAPVVPEVWHRHVQMPVAGGGFIEEGQSSRKVTGPERGPSPVEHRISRFELLAGFSEQASCGHEVSIRAAG